MNTIDLQWKFELWACNVFVLNCLVQEVIDYIENPMGNNLNGSIYSKSEEFYSLTPFHQVGLLPSLFGVLKYIHVVHGINSDRKVERKKYAIPVQPYSNIEFAYNHDDTLSNLLFQIFLLIEKLCKSNKAARDIVSWKEHLLILKVYEKYQDLTISYLAAKLFSTITEEFGILQKTEKQLTKQDISDISLFSVKEWPAFLTAACKLLPPEIQSNIYIKMCSKCRTVENRVNQFYNENSCSKYCK
jgi:hypothetical protein